MQTTRPQLDLSTAIPGTMMDVPLTVHWIFQHAVNNHGAREVVSRLLQRMEREGAIVTERGSIRIRDAKSLAAMARAEQR